MINKKNVDEKFIVAIVFIKLSAMLLIPLAFIL